MACGLTWFGEDLFLETKSLTFERINLPLEKMDLVVINSADLPRLKDLPDVLGRRARHVVTENARVHLALQALKNSDVVRLGELFYTSHLSLKNNFQISVPAIDLLVDLSQKYDGTVGARLTGRGFWCVDRSEHRKKAGSGDGKHGDRHL